MQILYLFILSITVPGLFKDNKEGLELNVIVRLTVYANADQISTVKNNSNSLHAAVQSDEQSGIYLTVALKHERVCSYLPLNRTNKLSRIFECVLDSVLISPRPLPVP